MDVDVEPELLPPSVQLDEVLLHDHGALARVGLYGGSLSVVAADLTAACVPNDASVIAAIHASSQNDARLRHSRYRA